MTDSCCSETDCSISSAGHGTSECPANGSAGGIVDWTTVAALAKGPVPPRQDFRLCRDPGCEVVYFGSAGTRLTVDEITVRPGFKNGGGGLICYCFLHYEKDVRRDFSATGRTEVFESIKGEVEAGNCACEVRNPSGKCCLGEVRATIRSVGEELGVTA